MLPLTAVLEGLGYTLVAPDAPYKTMGAASRGRVCHYVMVFIRAGSITAMIICIFAHVQWRWGLNDRLAHG